MPIAPTTPASSQSSTPMPAPQKRLRACAPHKLLHSREKPASLASLPSVLNNICGLMRAALPAPVWVEYLLPLLFLKCLSDEWHAKRSAFTHQFPGQAEEIARQLAKQRLLLPQVLLPRIFPAKSQRAHQTVTPSSHESCLASVESLYQRRHVADIGTHIDAVLQAIEEANPLTMRGLFRHLRYNDARRLGNSTMRHSLWHAVLEQITRFDLREAAQQQAFAALWLELLGEQHWASQHGQLAMVARLLRQCWLPEPSAAPAPALAPAFAHYASLCDPFCGDAQLLLALRDIAQHADGQEHDPGQLAHARMSMLLPEVAKLLRESSQSHAQANKLETPATHQFLALQQANSLHQAQTSVDGLRQYELQVTDLCRHTPRWDAARLLEDPWRRFSHGLPPKDKPELLAVSHMLASATPGRGKFALFIQPGCLYRAGNEQWLRRQLLQAKALDAVILLPNHKRSGQQIALLLFDLARSPDEAVLMINASRPADTPRPSPQYQAELEAKIVKAFQHKHDLLGFAIKVSMEQINDHGDSWLPSSYLKTSSVQTELNVSEIEQSIAQLEKQSMLAQQRLMVALANLV